MFFNFFNYVSKFENLFRDKSQITHPELFNRPYKLLFVKEFPRELIQIMTEDGDYDSKIRSNMDLNCSFYHELKQLYFFKKTYEIQLKKMVLRQKLSRKFRFHEFINKYLTILSIYKYPLILWSLNWIILVIFFQEIVRFSVFSLLYFALVLTILQQSGFQMIWNASLLFSLLPNLVLMFLNVFLYLLKIFRN